LQDTLRLLSLWFNHGDKIRYQKDVENAMREGFKTINCDNWLAVIPQIIARIHIGHVRNGV
jgi:FKBP12-rapamycin complex-associated protein